MKAQEDEYTFSMREDGTVTNYRQKIRKHEKMTPSEIRGLMLKDVKRERRTHINVHWAWLILPLLIFIAAMLMVRVTVGPPTLPRCNSAFC